MWNTIIAAVVSLILGVLGSIGLNWKSSLQEAAKVEAEKAQLTQTIKDQQSEINKMRKIAEDNGTIMKELQQQNETLNDKLGSLNDYLNSEQAHKDSIKECHTKDGKIIHDSGSSEVLKRTIKELSGQ